MPANRQSAPVHLKEMKALAVVGMASAWSVGMLYSRRNVDSLDIMHRGMAMVTVDILVGHGMAFLRRFLQRGMRGGGGGRSVAWAYMIDQSILRDLLDGT